MVDNCAQDSNGYVSWTIVTQGKENLILNVTFFHKVGCQGAVQLGHPAPRFV